MISRKVVSDHLEVLDALTINLSNAATMRDRVRLAARVLEVFSECEGLIEQFVCAEIKRDTTPMEEVEAPEEPICTCEGPGGLSNCGIHCPF